MKLLLALEGRPISSRVVRPVALLPGSVAAKVIAHGDLPVTVVR